MSSIRLNSSSKIPRKYLPSVVLQRLDIPKNSIIYVVNTDTFESSNPKMRESKQELSDNCKDSKPDRRPKILSIEYICQNCHHSFETAELHRQHVLSHYTEENFQTAPIVEDSDSESEVSRSKTRSKTRIGSHLQNSLIQSSS